MLIERQIQRQIEANLFKGKTLVLFGPRQVGKTTLAEAILEVGRRLRARGQDVPGCVSG